MRTTASREQHAPNMPTPNPWLADGPYPTSHFNGGATDSVALAGPTHGRKLKAEDVKTVPIVFDSNPAVKKVGKDTIAFASGAVGIQKILLTDKAFDPINFVVYPGFEKQAARGNEAAIKSVLAQFDAARRSKDDAKILAAVKSTEEMGMNFETGINGVYNLFDRDGYHYCVYGGSKVLKSFDGNDPRGAIKIVKTVDVAAAMPPEAAKAVKRIIGLGMTYDGYLAAAAPGATVVLDRELNVKSYVTFSDEAVDNSIAIDEKNGIYVVTSKRMLKLVWTGSKLSTDEKDGAWESPYESIGDEALKLGSISRGSGTTPTLMGFGDDPDKLVVISDAARDGTNLVAFWRDEIPADFKQKAGTLSGRIADQIRIDISQLTIEPSPNVLGYGVAVINGSYPEPVPGVPGAPNAFTAGVTRKAPLGVQKFEWNVAERKFENAWTNEEIDNSDIMVPVVSGPTGLMYCANKTNGDYEYVGVDWNTGEVRERWNFPDDSRIWNAFGGITTILEDGDLMIGGAFAVKRLIDQDLTPSPTTGRAHAQSDARDRSARTGARVDTLRPGVV